MHQLRRLRATTTVMVAMTAFLAMSVTAAFAQYPPAVDFGVTCTVDGTDVNCGVQGAQAGESLDATATAEVAGVIYEETLTADEDGEASFSFSRAGHEDEDITVRVVGSESGEAASFTIAADDDEVDEDAPVEPAERDDAAAERLPVTGGQVVLLSLLGVGLVGGGLLALRKRGASIA